MDNSHAETPGRLQRLLSYLEQDPANAELLSESAEAALDAGQADLTATLLERRAAITPHTDRERALLSLVLMRRQDFKAARAVLEPLHASRPDDPALSFNLAWSRAADGDVEAALALLTAPLTFSMAQAATLEVQLLHSEQRLEQALERARIHLEAHPQHASLAAAVSVLAVDAEDLELARDMALRGGAHPDALTTLGTLALGDDEAEEARSLFERALQAQPQSARAWIGVGLVKLSAGDAKSAQADLEKGAQLFDDHIGSWIAAGWASLIGGDLAGARRHFERALAIDPAFGETQGSLGVLAILEGDLESASTLSQKALRLDPRCFSATLARALLLEAKGDAKAAHALIERALNTPIGPGGKTIAHSLARQGLFV